MCNNILLFLSNKKKAIRTQIILTVLFLAGCQYFQSEKLVKGEIFIVTQAGISNPLGLINIAAIEKKQLATVFSEALANYNENEKKLEEVILDRETKIKTLKDSEAKLWQQVVEIGKTKTVNSFIGKYRNPGDFFPIGRSEAEIDLESIKDFIKKSYGERTAKLRRDPNQFVSEYGSSAWDMPIIKDYFSKIREIESNVNLLNNEIKTLEEFQKGETLLLPVTSERVSSKSSSQGFFELSLTKGKEYYIIAVASRNLGSVKETYLWFEYIKVEKDRHDFYLSNDNILSVNDIEAILSSLERN
jgi:hypothetical protein